MKKIIYTLLICSALYSYNSTAQVTVENITGAQINTITTAVPFLLIAPDTRAGGMGDVGVATSPDANSIHWNPAKLGFAPNQMGLSVSYTPWLRRLVPDIALSYLSGYYKVDKFQTIGASLRYFTLGDIQFTNEFGQETIQFRPNEFAIDVAYGRKLSENFSGGIALRFVNSNLTGGTTVQGADSKPGRAVAADVSAYYRNDRLELGDKETELAFGVNVSNIGNKMSYTQTSKRDFIPINLKLGPSYTIYLDDYNKITFAADFNKLLVPTPPIYDTDSAGRPITVDGEFVILSGADPDRATANGMFGSFNDAPGIIVKDENGNPIRNADGSAQVQQGSVFSEEMNEFTWALGAEYWYDNQFALRAGYFWEHELKGNRKFFTVGAGIKYNVFGLDFSYLIPAYFDPANTQRSPLQNTLRFTLKFDFEAFKKQQEDEVTE
ncbi:MAG: type IX secretion system outer membrane channel protein PorV [Flavobacteriales bacterium]|nr:type IX secretion system outer membrane channel protein PorV [Flavobacteriales bacterium]